jgi:hypothetical protein
MRVKFNINQSPIGRKLLPYNLDLEKRIDRILDRFGILSKKKMFGGVGYLLNGNMVFGIHKQALLIRTSPKKEDKLLKREFVSIFDITGRPMKGWVLISPEGIGDDSQILELLNLGIEYTKTLPKK